MSIQSALRDFIDNQQASSSPGRPRSKLTRRIVLAAAGCLAVYVAAHSGFFIVQPTELANVRRFGSVLYPRSQPLQPGFHLKIPVIDTVDRVQVSLQTLPIPAFDVLTIDNQKVTIEENFNYTISNDQVYHVMYEVGRPGNIDIESQVIPVAHDRTARVFASQNMVTVNANREAIQHQVEKEVSTAVENLFGITPHSLQITAIKPSANFMASIDQATMAKNAAIAAENQLRTKQFEAQQVAATAKGQADAAIEQARGQAESIKLNAEANRQATIEQARGQAEATTLNAQASKARLVLEGEGLKTNLENQLSPFGTPDKYIQYLSAKAMLNWNGQQPQIVAGSGTGTSLVVPLPAASAQK
ncbi:MAG: hypothetical protein JO110_06600 [Acetobacteraceae bacterium]|nr:hypothetical protein [Acetobacteraceae bacterium]